MTKKSLSLITATLLFTTHNYAEERLELISVISSALIETNEKDATFSTELFTKEDIEKSNASNLYGFLNSQTSINVTPSYGNTFSQKLDLRGYGIEDGYQNLVVTVNRRKLNNIDATSQLLSTIPLASIEKIEIIKGTGSVEYGDGANAGIINIITNSKNDNYIKTYTGNNGTKYSALSLGYSSDTLILNGYLDYGSQDGSRKLQNGELDENFNRNKSLNIMYFPTESLELRAERSYSDMNIKYAGALTKDQYTNNPHQSSTVGWDTEQFLSSYVSSVGFTYDFSDVYSLDINFNDEDKVSNYISYSYKSDYAYKSYNSKFNIKKETYSISFGTDNFDGDRIGTYDITTKENQGLFILGEYHVDPQLTLSSGYRKEKVTYQHKIIAGATSSESENLNAFNLGFNYKLNTYNSIFANYNHSFQTPDIDRFFNYGGTFNTFIEPAKVDTYNFGLTNLQANNKLKLSIFRSNLKNEIYYYSTGDYIASFNTNIDKSHKYGLELFDKYLISNNLFTSINYSYIVAKIDRENEGGGSYNGKYLPGVSKHNITLNLGYEKAKFKSVLTHTYRSEAYASEDFENNFSQKQEAYHSTDLSLSYNYMDIEFFTKVQNIFDKKNGLWISDDEIYPMNFETTYYAGLKVKF